MLNQQHTYFLFKNTSIHKTLNSNKSLTDKFISTTFDYISLDSLLSCQKVLTSCIVM